MSHLSYLIFLRLTSLSHHLLSHFIFQFSFFIFRLSYFIFHLRLYLSLNLNLSSSYFSCRNLSLTLVIFQIVASLIISLFSYLVHLYAFSTLSVSLFLTLPLSLSSLSSLNTKRWMHKEKRIISREGSREKLHRREGWKRVNLLISYTGERRLKLRFGKNLF